jgi:hypothetical protein
MTPRDVDAIIQKLGEVQVALARLEERIDGHESHETRIRRCERWQAAMAGIVAFCVIELQVVGVAMAVLARTSGA